MLLLLETSHQDDVNKLMAFAKENNLQLSLIDDENNYVLPGKPLSDKELVQLIEKSRTSGTISMQNAHKIISSNYNAD